ncbi:type II secretion system protein J [Chloroflexota bacterium]
MMKKERGFTLVELAIAIAITGFIVSVLGGAIHQIVTVPEYGNEKMTAMHELQNIAHWVGIDGQMSKSASGGNQLILTLTDDSTINYVVEGTEFHRIAGTSNRTLAKNITSANFSVQNRMITMDITSTPAGRWGVTENGTYQVCLRPVQE